MNLTEHQKLVLKAVKMIIARQNERLFLLSCNLDILMYITGHTFRIFPVEGPKQI